MATFPTFSAAFEPFTQQIQHTKTAFIQVKAQPNRPLQLWDSKVGGMPYLPKDTEWPTAPDGRALFFLAQLNFGQMPALAPFPTQGIVSFFIADDDLYGMDFDDGEIQDTFRVLYFPEVIADTSRLQTNRPSRDYDLLPHHPDTEHPLTFVLGEEWVPSTDYQFAERFGGDFFAQFGEQEWQVLDEYNKAVKAQGHKVGGYAYFTQDDPRRPDDPMLLLFQLDSDELMDLMWGDMGVGHFFIREADLRQCNFSRVLYDWDGM